MAIKASVRASTTLDAHAPNRCALGNDGCARSARATAALRRKTKHLCERWRRAHCDAIQRGRVHPIVRSGAESCNRHAPNFVHVRSRETATWASRHSRHIQLPTMAHEIPSAQSALEIITISRKLHRLQHMRTWTQNASRLTSSCARQHYEHSRSNGCAVAAMSWVATRKVDGR